MAPTIDETEIGRHRQPRQSAGSAGVQRNDYAIGRRSAGLEETNGEHDEAFEEALRICVEMNARLRPSPTPAAHRLTVAPRRYSTSWSAEGLIGQADGSRPRPWLGRAYEMIAQWTKAATWNDSVSI